MEKRFRIVPRGIGLVIGCSTFPTWNGYTGLFASLATGNAVVVKPHPSVILPLALTVRIARDVLTEAGFDPKIATLAVHEPGEDTARQAQVYTEKAGVNQVIVDSTADFKGLARNLAFSLALYTGQMCTAPQNIYVPKDGIDTPDGHLSFDEVAAALAQGVDKLLADPARAVEVLGAVANDGVLRRLEAARSLGEIALDTRTIEHPHFPEATIRTPLIVKL